MAILECKGLCKSYGAEPALDRVDLSVEPGHIVGLLGLMDQLACALDGDRKA